MKATFKELPGFEARRKDYLSDEEFQAFQSVLMKNPKAGDVIKGTGGLRKVRLRRSSAGKASAVELESSITGIWKGSNFGYLPSMERMRCLI